MEKRRTTTVWVRCATAMVLVSGILVATGSAAAPVSAQQASPLEPHTMTDAGYWYAGQDLIGDYNPHNVGSLGTPASGFPGYAAYCNVNAVHNGGWSPSYGGNGYERDIYWAACVYGYPAATEVSIVPSFYQTNTTWNNTTPTCANDATHECSYGHGVYYATNSVGFPQGARTGPMPYTADESTASLAREKLPAPSFQGVLYGAGAEYTEQMVEAWGYPGLPPHWFEGGTDPSTITGDRTIGACAGSSDGATAITCSADPVNTLSGSYFSQKTDASLPGRGLPFDFTRVYDSKNQAASSLGKGWTSDWDVNLAVLPRAVVLHAETGATFRYEISTANPGGGYTYGATQGDVWSRLVQASDGTFTLTRRDGTVLRFNLVGGLTSMTDKLGNAITLDRSVANKVTLTDTLGRQVVLNYTGGLLSRMDIPGGRSVSYGYTGGLLTTVTDLRGNLTRYAYTPEGWLDTITDQVGNVVVDNTYDASGRVIAQADALSHTGTFGYATVNGQQVTTFTDYRGKQFKYTYDASGRLIQTDDPARTVVFAYQSGSAYQAQTETVVRDPNTTADDIVTTLGYNATGSLTSIAKPLGVNWSFARDQYGQPTVVTDPNGHRTLYAYDASGAKLQSITQVGKEGDPSDDITTSYSWSALTTTNCVTPSALDGKVITKVTDAYGADWKYCYDSRGEVTGTISPKGNRTTYQIDDATGRIAGVVTPRGYDAGQIVADHTWSYAYNGTDQVTSVTTPPTITDGSTKPVRKLTSYDYYPNGKLRTVTDPLGRVTTYSYDAVGRVTSVLPAGAPATTYEYTDNAQGEIQVKRRVPFDSTTTRDWIYRYDSLGRPTAETSPLGTSWTYAYDDMNSKVTKTGPRGATSYAYDKLGNLSAVNYPASTPTVPAPANLDLTWSKMGGLLTVSDDGNPATVETAYSYDDQDRLVQVTRGSDAISYSYKDVATGKDAAWHVTKRVYPTHTVSYGYDADGNMQDVYFGADSTAPKAAYVYDSDGNLKTTTYPTSTAVTEARTYDNAGLVSSVVHKRGTTALSSFTYAYDKAGSPTKVTIAGGAGPTALTYGYDATRGWLKSATCTPTKSCNNLASITYTYNADGSRKTEARGTTTTTYSYNPDGSIKNTVTGSTTTNYGYDADGNLTSAGAGRSYVYDVANRMTNATVSGTAISYAYDGLGRRLSARSGAASGINYLWDPNYPLPMLALERDNSATPAPLRWYSYGQGLARFRAEDGNNHYYLKDALGSVVGYTSGAGALERSYAYEPFGSVWKDTKQVSTAPANFMGFAGEYADNAPNLATGLMHLRARQYAPTTGQFLGLDPIRPDSLSPYAYAGNLPTMATDPSGLWCLIHDSGGGCLGGSIPRAGGWLWDQSMDVVGAPLALLAQVTPGGNLNQCQLPGGGTATCVTNTWVHPPGFDITIGHYVFSGGDLNAQTLCHEGVHVRQQELWGPLSPGAFLGGIVVGGLAHPAATLAHPTSAYFNSPLEQPAYAAGAGFDPATGSCQSAPGVSSK